MKKNKRKLVLPLLIAFIMVSSIFAGIFYGASGEDPATTLSFDYNGYTFEQQGQIWVTTPSDGVPLQLSYNPEQLGTDIPSLPLVQLQNAQKIYISIKPIQSDQRAPGELYANLKPRKNVVFSCFEDVEGCESLPLKTCADATAEIPVVIFDLGEENSADFTNNCYTIQGDQTFVLQTVDHLLLRYFNILA